MTLRRFSMQGFSLMELMVALAVGMVLATAAAQLFVTNQVTFNLQRGLGDVQENGSFAMDYINFDVRQAGMAPQGDSGVNRAKAVVLDVTDIPGGTAAILTQNAKSSMAGYPDSDQLTIQYQTEFDTTDCEGKPVAKGMYVVSRYFLRADTTGAAASGSTSALACDGGWHDKGDGDRPDAGIYTLHDMGDDGVVLMSSVQSFQVMVGVGNGTTDDVPLRYLTLTQYKALAAPPRILSVRIGVLVSSLNKAMKSVAPSVDMQVLDQTVAAATLNAANAQGFVRRVYTSTIRLRNKAR